ncbi:MAG: hypothetical protein HAW67_00160 [Endozoicomonadaceae bacterium]|nr:hypothetical protein [Endozoicomonadaceae bacterium]
MEFDGDDANDYIDRVFRQMKVFGCLSKNKNHEVGQCDVLNNDGDIIHQFGLTSYGLKWMCKKFNLKIVKFKI